MLRALALFAAGLLVAMPAMASPVVYAFGAFDVGAGDALGDACTAPPLERLTSNCVAVPAALQGDSVRLQASAAGGAPVVAQACFYDAEGARVGACFDNLQGYDGGGAYGGDRVPVGAVAMAVTAAAGARVTWALSSPY